MLAARSTCRPSRSTTAPSTRSVSGWENVAYLPDVVSIPETAWDMLAGLDVWIVDALRRTPHPTHAHLALTLEWIERAKPLRAVLTNMHIDLDYDTLEAETADHITPAFDGMVITVEV